MKISALALFLVLAAFPGMGQQSPAGLDSALIERLTGAKGALDTAEGVFKVSVPRTDLGPGGCRRAHGSPSGPHGGEHLGRPPLTRLAGIAHPLSVHDGAWWCILEPCRLSRDPSVRA
jgi:hypothetical protein